MAKRNRRADEVIPKLHYRPGVEDPDLEATIVGFYGARGEEPVRSPAQSQSIDNTGLTMPGDTVSVVSPATVSADVPPATVAPGQQDTVADDPTDTVSSGPPDTVAPDTRDTVSVGSPKSRLTSDDRAEEGSRHTYEGIAKKHSTDIVSAESPATVSVVSGETVSVGATDTMAACSPETVSADRPPGPANGLWYTEGKEGIFPASRIRRIILAQDALTHAEESVYDVLWGPKNQNRDEQRLTSLGYDGISKAARVTKMNAKWIVERLIHKGFVKVETLPDPLRRIPTCYRVFSYRAALEDMRRRNRFHIVRTGNGVLFAHPFTPADTVSVGSVDIVAHGQPETISVGQSATVTPGQAATVPRGPQATVSVADTLLDSSSEAILIRVINAATNQIIGNDAATTIVSRCRAQAPDCTNDELADIARMEATKAIQERRSSLTGWLITVLPGRFTGDSFRIYRETKQQIREQECKARKEQEQQWRRVLNDPTESTEMHQLAREVLGIEQGREEEPPV